MGDDDSAERARPQARVVAVPATALRLRSGPALQTLEVLRLQNGLWVLVGTHVDDEVVRAEPFVEIDLELRLLWAEPADASS